MFWGRKRHFLGTAPGVQVCSAHGRAALYRGAPLLGVSRVLPDPERFSCPVLCTNKPSVLRPALPGAPRGICLCPAPGPCCSPDPVGSSGWHGAHALCRGAEACATAAATETQSCQHSVSFSKAPCPEARGWGREEISRCWISSFSSYKGAVGLLLPVASVLVGIFSLHFPAGEPQSSQCPSLGFFFGNLSCFEQGSGAEGVCTLRAAPPLPELVPSRTRGPRVPINPAPPNFALPAPGSEGRRLNITWYLWGRRRGPGPFLHHFFSWCPPP